MNTIKIKKSNKTITLNDKIYYGYKISELPNSFGIKKYYVDFFNKNGLTYIQKLNLQF